MEKPTDTAIRPLHETELPAASALAGRVFAEFEAPEYSPEGIGAFLRFAAPETLAAQHRNGSMQSWGRFSAGNAHRDHHPDAPQPLVPPFRGESLPSAGHRPCPVLRTARPLPHGTGHTPDHGKLLALRRRSLPQAGIPRDRRRTHRRRHPVHTDGIPIYIKRTGLRSEPGYKYLPEMHPAYFAGAVAGAVAVESAGAGSS